jgi:predicted acetyltransferase
VSITIDVPTEDDWPAMWQLDGRTFLQAVDDDAAQLHLGVIEFPRALVARREGEIVGNSGIYTRQLAVPGAVVDAAHVTLVSVASTARRQKVLTRMMDTLFEGAMAAGEPIAVLWASEGRIYQRFGYGLATQRLRVTVPTREVRVAGSPSGGVIRERPVDELRDAMVKVYDELFPQRPGWSSREQRHWDFRLADPPSWRGGGAPLRTVVHEGPSGVDGYALFRTQEHWHDGGPDGEVQVRELVATNPTATAGLWRFLCDIDLTRRVTASADHAVLYLVDEPRQLQPRWGDGLWVRLLDLPAALAARRYAAPVDVVLSVTDTRLPANAGRWRLTGSPDSAACAPTTDEPDLALDVKELGAAYLGGTPLASLAAAGLVDELTPGALARTSTAFGWWVPPSMTEVF